MLGFKSVTVTYRDNVVLRDISLTVNARERVGVVGVNGVGKTTLLKVANHMVNPSKGSVVIEGSVGYVPQDFSLDPALPVVEYVKRQVGIAEPEAVMQAAEKAYANDGEPEDIQAYLDSMELYRQRGGYEFDGQFAKLLKQLKLPARLAEQKLGELSGGQQIKIGLVSVLLSRYDVYLLDEPTNNLDLKGIELLETFVADSSAAFLIVSHDRRFLDKTITGIFELDEFTHQGSFYGVNFSEYQELRHLSKEAAARRYEDFVAEKKRLEASAASKAQQAGSGRVSRSDNDKLGSNYRGSRASSAQAGQARQIRKRLEQLGEVEKPRDKWELRMSLRAAKPSSSQVCLLEAAEVTLGTFHFGPVDLSITSADRMAIIGENGAGKSTLLKLITGELPPEFGKVVIGPSVTFGRLDQDHRLVDRDRSVLANARKHITGMPNDEIRGLLAKFNLGSDMMDRMVSSVSPGERARLQLAILMANGANTLLLDEPTNHLDLEAQEQLEIALQSFDGTLLVVSHDREFLNNIGIDRIVEISDGELTENWDLIRLVE